MLHTAVLSSLEVVKVVVRAGAILNAEYTVPSVTHSSLHLFQQVLTLYSLLDECLRQENEYTSHSNREREGFHRPIFH